MLLLTGICKKTLTEDAGAIASPNFPNSYPRLADCAWVIDLGMGRDITLKFETFLLEKNDGCSFDYVKVQVGKLKDGKVLGQFCSRDRPDPQFTEGPMRITFISDTDNEFPGFNATYQAVGKFSFRGKRLLQTFKAYCYCGCSLFFVKTTLYLKYNIAHFPLNSAHTLEKIQAHSMESPD